MKKYISIIILLSLFVIGCSEQTSINSPVSDLNINEPNWITLPQEVGMSIEKISSSSKSVNGANGTTWPWSTSYTGTLGRVTISSTLVVEPNSFSGTKTITQKHDDATCATTFGPSMVFNIPLSFTIKYTGIDLSQINPATVKFAYISNDGSVVYAVNDGIVIDLSTGTLQVINAQIPHFSRYGFINGTAD
jgi:hypothetical protein